MGVTDGLLVGAADGLPVGWRVVGDNDGLGVG